MLAGPPQTIGKPRLQMHIIHRCARFSQSFLRGKTSVFPTPFLSGRVLRSQSSLRARPDSNWEPRVWSAMFYRWNYRPVGTTVTESAHSDNIKPPDGGFIGLLLAFLVSCRLLAPFAELFELDFTLNFLFVLAAPVVCSLTFWAGEFDELILRHSSLGFRQKSLIWTWEQL